MARRSLGRRAKGSVLDVYVLDRAGVLSLDRAAMEQFGIPGIVLMENAARHAADVALALLEEVRRPRVTIVCGSGNNGGDGFAMSRHLCNAGVEVLVVMLSPLKELKGDAAINARGVAAMGVETVWLRGDVGARISRLARDTDLVVDAIFGTGLDRVVAGRHLNAIRAINRWRGRAVAKSHRAVLSLDIPSGLDCDAGHALGDAVRADVTVTFAGLKRGFLLSSAWEFLGEVVVADIGAPWELLDRFGKRIDGEDRTARRIGVAGSNHPRRTARRR